jgi:diacylglycerol kinase family enzyme
MLMAHYTAITIIYNPNSTGPGATMSRDLKTKLIKALPKTKIKRVKTKHAGHAETLAYEAAKASHRPLVISVSGDGGYHEVINGLMKAQLEGARPVAGLLPGGNANDHHRMLQQGDFVQNIVSQTEQTIDLLKLSAIAKGKSVERFGHSYIGIGLTPKAGKELNETKLNRLKETVIVLRSIIWLRPVRIVVDGKKRAYDSIIFSNIDTMSKVLKLSKNAKLDVGKFEVTAFRRRNRWRLIRLLLRASTRGLDGTTHRKKYSFTTTTPLLVQVDGEIMSVDADSRVAITSERALLHCIV